MGRMSRSVLSTFCRCSPAHISSGHGGEEGNVSNMIDGIGSPV